MNEELCRLSEEFGRELVRLAKVDHCDARCEGCAFRLGSEANRAPHTLLKAMRCLTYGGTFYCHEGLEPGEQPHRLCTGFVAAHKQEVLEGAAHEVAKFA